MNRLLAVILVYVTVSAPALAQKKKPYEKFVPKSQQQPEDNETDGSGDGMPLPSREALDKSELPGFAKCALNCSRQTQRCSAQCKGNSSCVAGCQKPYLACAQRCGGPIGTNPRGNGGGGGAGDDKGGGNCANACVSAMNDCRAACAGKPGCAQKCGEEMSSCASSCD